MVLVAVIVWVVVVGACFVYALVSGLRTFRRIRAAQATLQGRMVVLEVEGLGVLDERTAELSEKLTRMQIALEKLEHSLAGLEVLTTSVSGVGTTLIILRRLVRR